MREMSTGNIMMGHSLKERACLLNKELDLRETLMVMIQIKKIQESNLSIRVYSENYDSAVIEEAMGMNMLSILSKVSTK